jgi:hypothetical protein
MTAAVEWYRSADRPPAIRRTLRRAIRDWVRARLPEPDVADRVIVLESRRTLPRPTRHGLRSDHHGLFSEYHSVLGALVYARAHGAAGVRVDFRSPLYVEPPRGPNWWTYFFERDLMLVRDDVPAPAERRLDGIVARYGRFGGFSDEVQGQTPYFYPMTAGVDRRTLHDLAARFLAIRRELRVEAAQLARDRFDPAAFVVGVHYRGTDAVYGRAKGRLTHYRTAPTPYSAYADEVGRAVSRAGARRFQVFAATDEAPFVAFMRDAFPGRVVALDAPRADAGGRPVHLDESLPVSKYEKGKSAILDALLLASTHYLVKGRSNLSDASLVFNPDLPYSFCPDVPIRIGRGESRS